MSNPVLVNSLRGDVVENRHRGTVVVCDPRGRVVLSLGDSEGLVFPRSSIKALQAVPLVESGAADHFEVSSAELALACSSHNAEPLHTSTVSKWLSRLGLNRDDLECGAHAAQHSDTAEKMLVDGIAPDRTHNNCSGKHTGMLATACFYNEETRGYIDREHPAQQRWFDVLGEMGDLQMRDLPWGYDGCGIPVIAMPLRSIAHAFAHFAAPDELPPQRAVAVDRIATAIAEHPFMVAGSGRLCTAIMEITGRRAMVKTGADGVFAAALPESGLGIAIKIDDGTREAAEVSLLATLRHFNVLSDDECAALADRIRIPVHNTRGVVTGYREAAAVWQMQAG